MRASGRIVARLRGLPDRLRRGELGGLAADTAWVGVWQASTAAAAFIQVAVLTRAFGITGYGRIAIVIALVELVGGLLNPRVAYASTTFGARWLTRDPRTAVGVFQFGWLIDLVGTAAGLAVIAVLAVLAGDHFAGEGSTGLVLLYSLALIGHTLTRLAQVVLRLLDRFALIATYGWALEFGRIGAILLAIAMFDTLTAVIAAIVVATLVSGIINVVVAAVAMRRKHGLSLIAPALGRLERRERRAMLTTTSHTVVISSGRAVQTQLPTVLLGAIAGASHAGVYKVGLAAAQSIGLLIAPASNALLPRLARLWAAGRIGELRRLVAQASTISAVLVALAFLALVVFQDPVLDLVVGGNGAPDEAGTVLVLGGAAQAMYGLVFWHNTLLFAAHRTGPMSVISVVTAVVQIGAIVALAPSLEAIGAAIALLASQALANVALAILAVRTLRAAGGSVRPVVG